MSTGYRTPARWDAIRETMSRIPRKIPTPVDDNGRPMNVSEYFGVNTFGLDRMKEKLPRDVHNKLLEIIHMGSRLEPAVADAVAHAVKEWALAHGVTHYCHWFQPMTGTTAEKHDAFLAFDEHDRPIEKFSGAMLIQSEPDASSFPSGGIRSTFEARGYAGWDPSSPMFIMEATNTRTLCIPSVFISYHGDALDEKTGLMRSMESLSKRSLELLKLIGDKSVKRVLPSLGAEQEYFLIDKSFYALRPDLVMTGRTLLGSQPSRHQQLEDHYFGSIPSRALAFMAELEMELFKLGVPIKTRHNEVAPGQFETAPVYRELNVATDQNQLVMELLRKVARRHDLHAIVHEKPFAGVNGTGKHCNFSMAAMSSYSDGENLLEPGKTPHENLRFLLFLMGVLKGVHKHSGLLRAGIASHGNDHRLGANEAPPAIISVFLGNMLTKIVTTLETGTNFDTNPEESVLKLGVSRLPDFAKDNTDRNRTSPFAFTGNKFEFRAVGGSLSTAVPMTYLLAAVADGVEEITRALQAEIPKHKTLDAAILMVLQAAAKETKNIRFEGNGYSDEWVQEAAKRGLPNLKKTPEALDQLKTKESVSLMSRMGIFSEAEMMSRYHVRVERYVKSMLIEAGTLKEMVDTMVLPACFAYHGTLAKAMADAKAAGIKAPQADMLTKLSDLLNQVHTKGGQLETAMSVTDALASEDEKAKALSEKVLPAMEALRGVCDEMEMIVADDYWPLPKYREMLFL